MWCGMSSGFPGKEELHCRWDCKFGDFAWEKEGQDSSEYSISLMMQVVVLLSQDLCP